MKKFLVMLLLVGMLTVLLTSCVEPDIGAEQTDATTAAAEESTEKAMLDNVPKDLNYKGEEVVILSRSMQG